MKARCSDCGKRPARRMGRCVKCAVTEADERYARVRLNKTETATCRGSFSGYQRGCRCELCCLASLHYTRNVEMLEALESAEKFEARRAQRAEREAERFAERSRELAERRVERREQRQIASVRRFQRGWESKRVWLDELLDGGQPRHQMVAAPLETSEPYHHLEAQLLDSLVGDLSISDIQQMTDEQLGPLRRRLIAEGFVTARVQAKERERLRAPERHRGNAPAATVGRMATQHKHRKPGHQSSSGGQRSARKTERRWSRDTIQYDWKAAA